MLLYSAPNSKFLPILLILLEAVAVRIVFVYREAFLICRDCGEMGQSLKYIWREKCFFVNQQ